MIDFKVYLINELVITYFFSTLNEYFFLIFFVSVIMKGLGVKVFEISLFEKMRIYGEMKIRL